MTANTVTFTTDNFTTTTSKLLSHYLLTVPLCNLRAELALFQHYESTFCRSISLHHMFFIVIDLGNLSLSNKKRKTTGALFNFRKAFNRNT